VDSQPERTKVTALGSSWLPSLSVVNIDPDNAGESCRKRVLAQLRVAAGDAERAAVGDRFF
jgi:hypothetical protein